MPFLFGVAAFTSLGMAIGSLFELVRYIVENGMSMTLAAQIFVLRLPSIVVLTFPMSVLLCTLLAYSRLTADSEIVALKACGVSVYRIIAPAIGMSVLVTGLTFVFNEQIVPSATYEASLALAKALETEVPAFKKDNIFYPVFETIQDEKGNVNRELTRILYARRYNQGAMENMTVLDFSQNNLSQIIKAKRGIWLPKEQLWRFEKGVVYGVDQVGNYRNIAKFDTYQMNLSYRPIELVEKSRRRPEEMTVAQLSEYIRLMGEAGQDTVGLWVQLHQKFAIPFTCVSFALVGATMGLRRQRTTGALGLGVSILIIFFFYVASFLTNAWGQLGVLNPLLAAWLPNLITLGIGGVLLSRVAR